MRLSFENKVALVTGAGTGMGLAAAQSFAAEGAAVEYCGIVEEVGGAVTSVKPGEAVPNSPARDPQNTLLAP